MPKVLTSEQIEQYHDEGFISPVRVMSTDEALSIKKELERVEAEFPEEMNSESRNNIKANKKTLLYKREYGTDGVIYISEDDINQKCWICDNRFTISERVSRCNSYDKLLEIENILNK